MLSCLSPLLLLSALFCAGVFVNANDDFTTRGFHVGNFSRPPASQAGFLRTMSGATVLSDGSLLVSGTTSSAMGQTWVPCIKSCGGSGSSSSGSKRGPGSLGAAQGLLEVRGFRTQFAFQLGVPGEEGKAGEGISFVIQGTDDSQFGDLMGGMGYGTAGSGSGVKASLAIEFDTNLDAALLDPSANHVSVHTRFGSASNSANESYSLNSSSIVPTLPSLGVHTVLIEYLPPLRGAAGYGLLSIKFDGLGASSVTAKVRMEHNISLIEDRYAYVGFTGATKPSEGFTQRVFNWTFDFLGVSTPSECVAAGKGIRNATAGTPASFTIQAVDQFGNDMATSFETNFSAVLKSQPSLPVAISYLGRGKYEGKYTPTLAATAADLDIRLGGTLIKGAPHSVTVVAGAVSPSECEAFDGKDQVSFFVNLRECMFVCCCCCCCCCFS
jgi:Legume lectin domain/Filamin/ABP280 repeat